MIDWTDQNIAKLRCLADEKRSAAVIAAELGYPEGRMAVIGKARRLGIQLKGGRGGPNRHPHAGPGRPSANGGGHA